MRNLCFGGTFNPIHIGHVLCARAAAEYAGFDRITLIPSLQPPHKQADTHFASPPQRLQMCRLAIQNDPLFTLDEIELNRTGPSYTIETVRELRRRGHNEITWLIGADMANYLPQWHDVASLLNEVRFILMARPGWTFDWANLPPAYQHLQGQIVPTPLIDISSTEIRKRVATGLSIRYMTPPAVEDYIIGNGLYLDKR